jgi:sarcosine oxidase subunit gamma
MSKAVSALNGATQNGAVTVSDTGLRGMITLRGDLSGTKIKSVVKSVTGLAMPKLGKIAVDGDNGLAWMSPDEVLVMVHYTDVDAAAEALTLGLKKQHVLVVNVSDARSVIRVSGAGARDVLARLTPVDMHASKLTAGDLRRARLAQVAGAFWLVDDTTIDLICFRSVSDYVYGLLTMASAHDAVEVFHS